MTVYEFDHQFNVAGKNYKVVDATKPGYRQNEVTMLEAGRSVVTDRFGDKEVVGFDIAGKNWLWLYVK